MVGQLNAVFRLLQASVKVFQLGVSNEPECVQARQEVKAGIKAAAQKSYADSMEGYNTPPEIVAQRKERERAEALASRRRMGWILKGGLVLWIIVMVLAWLNR